MYLIQFYLINLAICEKKITFAAEVCLCKPKILIGMVHMLSTFSTSF